MDFGISTRCFHNERLTPALLERLRVAEFTRIEIFAGSGFHYTDRGFTRSICGWFHENAGLLPSLHLPFEEDAGYGKKRPLALLDPERRVREQAMDQIKRCLELVERLPVAYAVLHVGRPGENFTPVKFDFAYAAIAA